MTSLNTDKDSGELKFPKKEKLSSKKLIEELFNKGSSSYLYPFRLFSLGKLPPDQDFPQVLVSVSKRNFKRAVDRNRIKRQIREAYRLNKKAIFSELKSDYIPLHLAILYTSKDKMEFKKLEEKLILLLKRLERVQP